jgi:pimeloyl-ACP methyl ester carboxylesterase
MTRLWDALVRHLVRHALRGVGRTFAPGRAPDAMAARDGERRMDAVTADVVQIGILFMTVFGAANAEAYLWTAGIHPAVARRILDGPFRRRCGPEPDRESVPA